ncbi:PepSY domain-containing protein [Bacillus sp. NP157]|nr:PepSY domain-containing protein [Bacillus sp. NP157]
MHSGTSLLCTVFLLLLCITGLPLVFQDEIEDALGSPHSVDVTPGSPLQSLDALLAAAQARYPGDATNFISLPDDDPGMATIGLVDAGGAYHWVKYDRHTGALLADQRHAGEQRVSFMDVVLALHGSLAAGLPGTLLLGLMGILFLVALVSGVVLYAPFTPRTGAGTLRLRGNRRLRWLDLHNVLGIVLLAWLGVVGLTGVINTLEKPLFGVWQATDVARLVAGQADTAVAGHGVTVQFAMDEALRRHPRETVASILFPSAARHQPRHFLVWLHGDTPLRRELLTPVLVDAGTGRVIDGERLPWYLSALEVSRPLHFGDYGGQPLKWLWFVFDVGAIVVLASGVYLWVARRRRRGKPAVGEPA